MRRLAVACLVCLGLPAFAGAPQGSMVVGGVSDSLRVYDTSGNVISIPAYASDGGAWESLAWDVNDTLWGRNCVFNTYTGLRFDNSQSYRSIPGLCSNYADIVNDDAGTLLFTDFAGNISSYDGDADSFSPLGVVDSGRTVDVKRVAFANDQLFFALEESVPPDIVRVLDYPALTLSHEVPLLVEAGNAFFALDDGDFLVAGAVFTPSTQFFIDRYDSGGQLWRAVTPARPTDASQAADGSIWVLTQDDEIWRFDAATGAEVGTNPFLTGASGSGTPQSILRVPGDPVDECPDNPSKTTPGTCGCDYNDVAASLPSGDPVVGTACVHYTASYDATAHAQDGTYVEAYASVGARADLGSMSIIAERASIGADATLADSVIVGRRATVEADASVGTETVLARASRVSSEAVVGAYNAIGYGTTVGANALVHDYVTLGSLVTLSNNTEVGRLVDDEAEVVPLTVIARSTSLAPFALIEAGAVIGPQGIIGQSTQIMEGARLRKEVTTGNNATVFTSARLGRNVTLGNFAHVYARAIVGANATVSDNNCVAADTSVPRGTTVTGTSCGA